MRHHKSALLSLCFFMIFCFVAVCPALATDRAIAVMKETPSPYAPESEAAYTVPVEPNVEKVLIGWTEYNTTTCQLVDTGTWEVTTAPNHGTLRFALENHPLSGGPCDGVVLPFNVAYYTWTDTTSEDTQDSFSLRWFTADSFSSPSDWIAKKQTAVFMEHGVNYGWDDFTDPKVPSKSVGKGHKDTVLAEISPAELFSSCGFKSSTKSHVTVSPSIAKSASQIVTLKGIDIGTSVVQAKNTKSSVALSKINAATYENLKKTVSVTLVHKKGTGAGDPGYRSQDISTTAIRRLLKKVYKQAVIQWEVTRLPAKRVAFDLNKDGKIDVDSWMSGEMQKIRDACKSNHDYNIFIVSNPSDGSCGFMEFNQKYGFIHANTCGNARTVSHELGHGQGLAHTPDDTINIMYNYSSETKWRLRWNQWNQLNP